MGSKSNKDRKRRDHRRHFKVEQLKSRSLVDRMLADGYTYEDIVAAVAKQGERITTASISRYNGSFERVAERIKRTREQLEVLVEAVREKPDTNLAQVANELMMQGLIERISTAQDEFADIPLEQAGKLVASLEKSAVAREKLKYEFDKGITAAHEAFKEQIRQELKENPALLQQMIEMADKAQEKLLKEQR